MRHDFMNLITKKLSKDYHITIVLVNFNNANDI